MSALSLEREYGTLHRDCRERSRALFSSASSHNAATPYNQSSM
jgi:hypothetical protein